MIHRTIAQCSRIHIPSYFCTLQSFVWFQWKRCSIDWNGIVQIQEMEWKKNQRNTASAALLLVHNVASAQDKGSRNRFSLASYLFLGCFDIANEKVAQWNRSTNIMHKIAKFQATKDEAIAIEDERRICLITVMKEYFRCVFGIRFVSFLFELVIFLWAFFYCLTRLLSSMAFIT